jgi:Tfp pilus assembly ATPase PilU
MTHSDSIKCYYFVFFYTEAYCRKNATGPDQILRLRNERSLPVLEKLKLWAQQQEVALNPRSLIAVVGQ